MQPWKLVLFDGDAAAYLNLTHFANADKLFIAVDPKFHDRIWLRQKQFLPIKIQHCWNETHRITKVGFGKGGPSRAPKKFDIIGFTEGLPHKKLLQVDDADWKGERNFQSWIIPEEKRSDFPCYGLILWESEASVISLQRIHMWEEA